MIRKFVELWNKNKGCLSKELEQIISTKKDSDFHTKDLLLLLIHSVINKNETNLDTSTISQETEYPSKIIFKIKSDIGKTYTTYSFYGTCSLCDILIKTKEEKDNRKKLHMYMLLCMHLLQRFAQLGYDQLKENNNKLIDDDQLEGVNKRKLLLSFLECNNMSLSALAESYEYFNRGRAILSFEDIIWEVFEYYFRRLYLPYFVGDYEYNESIMEDMNDMLKQYIEDNYEKYIDYTIEYIDISDNEKYTKCTDGVCIY